MLKRIVTFIGWGVSSLFFLAGIASIATNQSAGIGMALLGLITLPPLYKATSRFGNGANIGARVVSFLMALSLIGSSAPDRSQSPVVEAPVVELTPTPAQKEKPKPEPIAKKSEPSPEQGITMANFKRIQTGMSYTKVVAILGKEGDEISSSDVAGIKTVMYKWGGGFMANMNAMFQNGKLVSKAQLGLK